MRKIDDKSAFVEEIQGFIIAIDEEGNTPVRVTGYYDERTKLAVKKFKGENGMPEDTEVDYETYELLYLKYKESNAKKRRNLQRGDRGDDVLELNMHLKAVGADYSEFVDFPHTEYFSSDTEYAIFYMKERFGMEADGVADGIFSERLKSEYMLISESGKNIL